MGFWYKLLFEVINLMLNNRVGFFLARSLKLFDAVFVMYPADQRFADYFTFRARQWLIRWRPFIVGWITHPSGRRSLMFAISTSVDESNSSPCPEKMRLFHERVLSIKRLLGVTTTHFAGTLPGRFSKLYIKRGTDQKNEREVTVSCVVDAVLSLREKLAHNGENRVIILGSRGYIGNHVVALLNQHGVMTVGIDLDTGVISYTPPSTPHIVVNLTVPEAVNQHVLSMREHTTLLNEVYPAPHSDVLAQLHDQGAGVFHIAGVRAYSFPAFPLAYQGAVPCCAALLGEIYEVVTVKL